MQKFAWLLILSSFIYTLLRCTYDITNLYFANVEYWLDIVLYLDVLKCYFTHYHITFMYVIYVHHFVSYAKYDIINQLNLEYLLFF